MNEKFVVVHFNGSPDGWVESGPYVNGWFETREQAETLAESLKATARDAGWYNRVCVWTAEEYYANTTE